MVKHAKPMSKMSDRAFRQLWKEARKDPNFAKEMKAFVKASTTVYSLD